MKALVLITSLSLVSHYSLADIKDIDAAANTMNINQLSQYSQNTSDYEQAYAFYRLAIIANVSGQRKQAANSLNQAQNTLENLLSAQATADSQALLAAVYGMQIALDNSKGAEFGMKTATLLQQASELEPTNPRVSLVKAINAFYTPSVFGGGLEKAQTFASQAITLYDLPCDTICWGQAEAYTWRGLAKQEQGDLTGATEDWQAAIDIEPQYGWAKFLLNQQAVKQ
ncbi:OspD family protein [Shewanella metallivivens]|uniref:OspD family protein n=1 Tax=Shewanella metallivivens TaxID=2872342 RepID=A0ABT5TR18_9GAMM|nr:OspD family protein [Shewanella metallivivens]MDD8060947.1 OspD family protein [Shewanella metallivivens]